MTCKCGDECYPDQTVSQELQRIWGRFENLKSQGRTNYHFLQAGSAILSLNDEDGRIYGSLAGRVCASIEDIAEIERHLEEKYPNICKCGDDIYKDQTRCPSCQLDEVEV